MITNNSKKRVLCFTSRFPRWPGDSVCNFVYYLARELTKHYEVFVLTPHDAQSKREEIMDGIRVIRFPYFYPPHLQALSNENGVMANIRESWMGKVQVPPFMLAELTALVRLIKREKIDAVNSHWIVPQGLTAALAQKFVSFGHAVTIHAGDIFALRRWPGGPAMTRFIAKNTDTFLPVSQFNLQILNEMVDFPVQAKVLPMGVDTSYFVPQRDRQTQRQKLGIDFERVVLFVGRLSEKKGIHYLIRAMQTVRQRLDGTGLVVVGSGPLEQDLRRQVAELGLEKRVHFAGAKDHEQLRDYYAAADVAVVPSIVDSKGDREGVPVVVLEALSTGIPVIATRVGGIPEVVRDGENGFLVQEKDSDALAQRIVQYFSGKHDMSATALQTAKNYDWTVIGLEYKKVLDAAMERK